MSNLMFLRNLVLVLVLGFAVGIAIVLWSPVQAQQGRRNSPAVQCWAVPNGANNTMQCNNGYWRTITPDGEEITGMGMSDPNDTMQGSGIVINPATGGIDITRGQTVTAPSQNYPVVQPGQANAYGLPHRTE